jgi:hypothetical protein
MGKNIKLSGQPIVSQLFSFIPDHLIQQAVAVYKSDHYYKTMTTRKQLALILYGVITRCHYLQGLCKSLLVLDNKLLYVDIDKLPVPSTLSDANVKRNRLLKDSLLIPCCQVFRQSKDLSTQKKGNSFNSSILVFLSCIIAIQNMPQCLK